MKVQYCQLCERMVKPTKKVNWFFVFISFCLCFVGIGVLLLLGYLPYYIFKSPECPICGSTDLLNATEKKALEKINEKKPKALESKK